MLLSGLRSARSRDMSESARIAKELQQKAQGTSEDEDSLSDNDTGSSDDDGYRDQKVSVEPPLSFKLRSLMLSLFLHSSPYLADSGSNRHKPRF